MTRHRLAGDRIQNRPPFPPYSSIRSNEPVELAEGTRVEVLPIEADRPTVGMREENRPRTPDGIAGLLARMDKVEPAWLSPEDDAAWRAALREQKEIEKARFFEDAEKLRRIWE